MDAYLVDLLKYIKTLEAALGSSYHRIALPSEEPVQFVGSYVLKWRHVDDPTIGFREWSEEEITALKGVKDE